jgi:hypothetical protein
MPVKIARSAPRPSFGLPELLVAIQPRVSLAARPEKREYLRQFGSHPGNPGSRGFDARAANGMINTRSDGRFSPWCGAVVPSDHQWVRLVFDSERTFEALEFDAA